uniref:Uncharacterized protein n=1 Tax=Calcidiscus leptoporus TaxID=127549 RepID=A0A7S0NTL9_9EUKA
MHTQATPYTPYTLLSLIPSLPLPSRALPASSLHTCTKSPAHSVTHTTGHVVLKRMQSRARALRARWLCAHAHNVCMCAERARVHVSVQGKMRYVCRHTECVPLHPLQQQRIEARRRRSS